MSLGPLARTRLSRVGLLATLLGVLLARAGMAQPAPDVATKGQRVFIAGHSFHMPIVQPLDEIARAAGIAGHIRAGTQGIGGSNVTKHWELPDDKDKARKAIKAGEVDVLTLAPNRLPLPDPAIDNFTALLLEHNPKGRVTLQSSWYPMDGPGNNPVTFTNAQRDTADPSTFRATWAPFGDRLREHAKALNEKYAPTLHRQVVFIVPVGEAVIRLRERVARGDVPGIARQSELFRDNLGHGKAPISVLTAYCHFAVIYGRNPVGLPAPEALKTAGLGEDTEKVNRILQEVAWEAVTTETLSGVKASEKG